MESHLIVPPPGSVRMIMIVSARLRVSPGRASEPTMSVFCGDDIIAAPGVSAARALAVIRAFASPTAPWMAR